MFRYILITISWFTAIQAVAQDTLILTEVEAISCFDVDVKGNYFVADKAFTLFKYDVKGKLITNVNIKSYGELTSIDCSNPFEIYAFYQDQNIIVFYDNMLNVRGELRLNDYYFNNVSCISRSFDNNIWIVDLSQYKLLKINKKGEIIAESPFLNNVLNQELNTYKIWDINNSVYIADSLVGVYQFDIYATYSKTYYIKNTKAVSSTKGMLFFKQEEKLISYNKLLREPLTIHSNLPKNTSFSFYQNKLTYFTKNKIISYPTEY
ncbi:MAG: hypothetical protein COA58_08265 [Bacteroidetes bacterium]|nr:MAG: hypothetical protein COA58_08265 [Bacteroidota bacterium]